MVRISEILILVFSRSCPRKTDITQIAALNIALHVFYDLDVSYARKHTYMTMMWEGGFEVTPSVLIGFLLFGILPYGPFHGNDHRPCIIFCFRKSYYKLPANLQSATKMVDTFTFLTPYFVTVIPFCPPSLSFQSPFPLNNVVPQLL